MKNATYKHCEDLKTSTEARCKSLETTAEKHLEKLELKASEREGKLEELLKSKDKHAHAVYSGEFVVLHTHKCIRLHAHSPTHTHTHTQTTHRFQGAGVEAVQGAQ